MGDNRSNGRFGIVGRVIGGIWGFVGGLKSFVGTLIFFLLLIFVVAAVLAPKDVVTVPDGAALVIAPSGLLVEQLREVDPVAKLMSEATGGAAPETAVGDVVEAIELAADDERITTLVLALDGMVIPGAYTSKSYDIAEAVDRFSEAGKKVIAVGDQYVQENYLIASHADEIWLHNFGGVFILGYERTVTYYKSMLDKLKISVHPFKVGEFKSAIEPVIRDDMSDAAREANLAYMGDLWADYSTHVEAQRGLSSGSLQARVDGIAENVRAAGGSFAEAALQGGFVDAVKDRPTMRADLIAMVGEDEETHSFKQIGMADYLSVARTHDMDGGADNVALIVAKGSIVNGEAPAGTIGGDSVARLIRNARQDENTKAIVLRVDSGGGSAFASEIIREEILAAKEAGIPVVASMGSIAASGGYWISTSTDEIWAAPTTITGSIGVIGSVMTFERSADWAGVHADTAGTSSLAGAFNPILPLNPVVADVMQQSVEEVYDRFLTIVSEGRDLPKARVAEIAEGRVWSGRDALGFGLVDKLGDLEDAIASAAAMAELEDYDVVEFKKKLTPFEQFVRDLSGEAKVRMGLEPEARFDSPVISKLRRQFVSDLEPLLRMNDPNDIYLICEYCEVR